MLQDFLQFVIQYWYLWSLFFALLALVFWFENRQVVGGITKLEAHELVHLINHDNASVIDIREKEAFQEGHVVGSLNYTLEEIEQNNKKLQSLKNKPIAIVCTTGQSAMKAAEGLKKSGFENLYILKGGINHWKSASLPLEKK